MSGAVTPRFDELIHEPNRLRICGLLAASSPLEFSVIRDTLEISDAACSKHLKVLADNGYVELEKRPGILNRHKVTLVHMLPAGDHAFAAHMAALRAIAEGRPLR
ncbi:transcriptional regulator [Bifidobacterium callimiconis]|uniref:Transcriptional regulator n=1 Tax=Bifidobacterium callimiconis TaxID=2306973 RepID=A0A430F7Y8_9BIFI|nr:transcriptional regulator [Bifidobacterium callimiconis]MBT1177100.1 transcriptional regulator [Bifidobacterium callimiconis]RSX49035.1 Transcriptional regulator [Bifidobacterium callimiconis]